MAYMYANFGEKIKKIGGGVFDEKQVILNWQPGVY
jgi:hypothetical protein